MIFYIFFIQAISVSHSWTPVNLSSQYISKNCQIPHFLDFCITKLASRCSQSARCWSHSAPRFSNSAHCCNQSHPVVARLHAVVATPHEEVAPSVGPIFDRPGVAGAVLKTAFSLIHSINFMCHVLNVTCQVSNVKCHVSPLIKYINIYIYVFIYIYIYSLYMVW